MKNEIKPKIANSFSDCELLILTKNINPCSESIKGQLNLKIKNGFMVKQIYLKLVKNETVKFVVHSTSNNNRELEKENYFAEDKFSIWEKTIPNTEINPSMQDIITFDMKICAKYPSTFKYEKNGFVVEIFYMIMAIIESQDINESITLSLPIEVESSELQCGQRPMSCETKVETGIICRNKGIFQFEIQTKFSSINLYSQNMNKYILNNLNSEESIISLKCILIEVIEGKGKSEKKGIERVNGDTSIISSWTIEGVRAKEQKEIEFKLTLPNDRKWETFGSSRGLYCVRSYCLIVHPDFENYTFCVKHEMKCPIYIANNKDEKESGSKLERIISSSSPIDNPNHQDTIHKLNI